MYSDSATGKNVMILGNSMIRSGLEGFIRIDTSYTFP